MINYDKRTLIALPHLDDEFALVPLLENLKRFSYKLTIIYLSERISAKEKLVNQRRKDNIRSLSKFGFKLNDIYYINDYFDVEDNSLYKCTLKIACFLENFIELNKFNQILTLDYEGGHPDHDTLALILRKICKRNHIKVFFFPAYNYRHNIIFPYSVLRPLKIKEKKALIIKFKKFCWFGTLRLALIYSTERLAFILLLPMLLFKSFFSNQIIFFDNIDINSVNWKKSLSLRRYGVRFKEIISKIDKI